MTQKKEEGCVFAKNGGIVRKLNLVFLRWKIAASVMDRLLKRLVFELAYLCSPYFADFLREYDLFYSGFASSRQIAKI